MSADKSFETVALEYFKKVNSHMANPKDVEVFGNFAKSQTMRAFRDGYLYALQNEPAILELVEVLKLLDKQSYFDRSNPDNYGTACMYCDTGGAGEKITDDGHDYNCPTSAGHKALKNFEALLGELK